MADARAINDLLQEQLSSKGIDEVTAVEAAELLDRAGVLRDSRHRLGLPLRRLLRAGRIDGAEQRPPRKYGRRFTTRVN